jgi:hypothetical protein
MDQVDNPLNSRDQIPKYTKTVQDKGTKSFPEIASPITVVRRESDAITTKFSDRKRPREQLAKFFVSYLW